MKGKLAIIAAAVLIGTAGTYILNENTVERDTVEIQQEIAQKILRFHVLANSDSEEDQALKLKVKEGVTGYLDQYLNEDGMTQKRLWRIRRKMLLYLHRRLSGKTDMITV